MPLPTAYQPPEIHASSLAHTERTEQLIAQSSQALERILEALERSRELLHRSRVTHRRLEDFVRQPAERVEQSEAVAAR
jgi:hypothetical protein